MKSVWVTGKRKIEVKEIQLSEPEYDEVIVKIMACGICGTDLHFYNDYPEKKITPLGHEVSGYIQKTGKGVTGFKTGDAVIVQNHVPCGKCDSCLNDRYSLCTDIQTYMDASSGMAEFLKVRKEMVIPFKNLNYVEAAIAEPVTVALDICREAQLNTFQSICISGPGIIGLSCVKIAELCGARKITVLGRDFQSARGKKRIEAARNMGAHAAFDTDDPEWKENIKKEFPDGIERIIITSPPASIPDTFDIASFGAVIAFNGISYREEKITFNANSFHFKKLKLIASHAIPNWGFPTAFKLLEEKTINHKTLITHTFPFDKIEEAFRTAASREKGVIKVVVTF